MSHFSRISIFRCSMKSPGQLVHRRSPCTAGDHPTHWPAGLWRTGFFEHVAFYVGTALRVVHGLPRFSEDHDFSLLKKRDDFSLRSSLSGHKTELSGFGFESEIVPNKKPYGPIESALIKAPARNHIVEVTPGSSIAGSVPSNQLIKVRLEIDTDPPEGFFRSRTGARTDTVQCTNVLPARPLCRENTLRPLHTVEIEGKGSGLVRYAVVSQKESPAALAAFRAEDAPIRALDRASPIERG